MTDIYSKMPPEPLMAAAEALVAAATPGPWAIENGRNLISIERPDPDEWPDIAFLERGHSNDAALIAAAPALLTALVAALRAERADVLYLIDAIRAGWVVLSGERGEFVIDTLRYLDIRAGHAGEEKP